MNRVEAKWLLLREFVRWQHRPYDELLPFIGNPHSFERRARSNVLYQFEIQADWDDKPNAVLVSLVRLMTVACVHIVRSHTAS